MSTLMLHLSQYIREPTDVHGLLGQSMERISEDTQGILQSRSTAFSRHQNKRNKEQAMTKQTPYTVNPRYNDIICSQRRSH